MTPVLGATLCRPSKLLALNCNSDRSITVSASTRVGLVGLPRSTWKLGRSGGKGRLVNARTFSTSDGTGWGGSSAQIEPLDLTEENVKQVLLDARSELLQLFDTSVGITGVAELVELDGPFVKLRLAGRFWHERSMVLARLANYLKKRIPTLGVVVMQEIVEVEIEDVSQLDDSAANF